MLQIFLKWMPINHVYSLIFCSTYFVEVVFFFTFNCYKKKKNICKINDKRDSFCWNVDFSTFHKNIGKTW